MPSARRTATRTRTTRTGASRAGGAGGVVAAPAQAAPSSSTDFGSVDLGSSELGTPNSNFLWQSPGTRYIVVLGAKFGVLGQTPDVLKRRLDVAANLGKKHPFNRMIVSGGDVLFKS